MACAAESLGRVKNNPLALVPSLAPGSASNRQRFKGFSVKPPAQSTIGSAFAHR